MPRKLKNEKPYIEVFCEGESEQAYTDFLREKFRDIAVIHRPKSTGTFDEADGKYRNDQKYKNNAEVTDEIWFFFDVETVDIPKWDSRMCIIKRLRSLRKRPNIRVRLLMTTGCIEYWLMLHYEMSAPLIQTVAEKERMLDKLTAKEPTYKKGDYDAISKIAANYPTAVTNARKTVTNLLSQGLPGIEDTDERNRWLCTQCLTFSTVYEAIEFLESLKE